MIEINLPQSEFHPPYTTFEFLQITLFVFLPFGGYTFKVLFSLIENIDNLVNVQVLIVHKGSFEHSRLPVHMTAVINGISIYTMQGVVFELCLLFNPTYDQRIQLFPAELDEVVVLEVE